jgi:hypothetical protein
MVLRTRFWVSLCRMDTLLLGNHCSYFLSPLCCVRLIPFPLTLSRPPAYTRTFVGSATTVGMQLCTAQGTGIVAVLVSYIS